MADLIPVCLTYAELNLQNHLTTIKYAALGPADPRQPSTAYWQNKAASGQLETKQLLHKKYVDNMG